ncbi:MAG TPA: Hsp20/alpha crystallin family protein [Syntrophaceticus sp.]|jgi:HSP20 family protein|uniref:Putative Heat shock protein Hsp20 n=1 Tax=Syntrophaceticus schinkii TaxID=499207 RepID=A0A0B7MAE9_9FIRM|nr:Hsp20/alpha crystallin family protein [Syntrophaceticus schinkii]HHY29819.1 Hsp20/alpha crystallin family protein [Syntrophaceticus sp.]MDD2360842.1 Hsp20/alpha crystallin family protein [Syntrophaceticus schinkii]MDD4675765.1 Hsp20/alpha crystallin family protein [Syntrophaceticus schinkii]MDD4675894.1 Hsp20/alpha crystallin family protein [Syntrophaceticus schinkii]CEO87474.1 putative Heat shock protein Hsp20 [Syntrophaceticus schinkii]
MSMMRKDPWRELANFRDSVNRLFDETVGKRLPVPSWPGWMEWKPSVDIVDEGEQFVVKADLPGYSSENIKIKVTENSVSIRGELKEEKEFQDTCYQVRERSAGSFSRTLPFSILLKPEESKASFKNGVLEITLPKAEVPKGRTLDIETE